MKPGYLLSIIIGLLAVIDAQAADQQPGKALYSSCIACHGANAEGNPAMQGPSLTGQPREYLVRQLTNFIAGIRGADSNDVLGAQMRAMALAISSEKGSEQAVEDIASYISTLPVTGPTTRVSGDLRNGNNLYHGNCGTCHGGKAQGNPQLNAPRLAGLEGDYLIRQYNNFSSGLRGSHKDDRYGRQMKFIANSAVSEKDLRDIVAFIHAQRIE